MWLAALGLVAGLAGTVVQMAGANAQAQASKRAEKLRETQMNLESARQKRQIIRNALRARSMALVNATGQGASSGSGLQGGYGQISQGTNENLQGVNQGQTIGAGIFKANRDSFDASNMVSFGGGLTSLGGSIVDNASTIGNIAAYAFGNRSP